MNKSQLKTGMVFELGNGKQFLLLRDTPTVRNGQIMMQGTDLAISINGNEEQVDLINYTYHLRCYGNDRGLDIVKVSIPKSPKQLLNATNMELVTMWEREQKGAIQYGQT